MPRSALLVAVFVVAACTRASSAPPAPAKAPSHFVLVATSEIRGTPEPCGCTSDPLGDVARVASLVDEARRSGAAALLVDAGGLRYNDEPIAPERRAQAEAKADFLDGTWHALGAVVGLGDEDLRFGAGKVPSWRLCANVAGALKLDGETLRDAGGIQVGVFAVLDPSKTVPQGVTLSDPIAAARQSVQRLRAKGAQVVVALVHMARADVRHLVRTVPGITVAVVGDDVGDQGGAPERLGDTLVVQPADQAQRAARVDFVLGANGALSTVLFGGEPERKARLARIAARLVELDGEIKRMKADPKADPTFVKDREKEQADLVAEKAQLEAHAPVAPPAPYAVAELVPVSRKIPRDPTVATRMKDLDKRVGQANFDAAKGVPVPPPEAGEPGYVGIEVCGDCHRHEANVAFWQKTVHARAWQELVAVDKQWSYDCIKCHVTGYGQRGGSAMAHVEGLENVQCEVCHGPGSLHVKKPSVTKMPVISPGPEVCKNCHTPEHSDTFNYEAYLRDVTGPDHGAKRRAALGPGPTGHELRAAAIAKAKAAGDLDGKMQ